MTTSAPKASLVESDNIRDESMVGCGVWLVARHNQGEARLLRTRFNSAENCLHKLQADFANSFCDFDRVLRWDQLAPLRLGAPNEDRRPAVGSREPVLERLDSYFP